jgi:hypothetical protein
MISLPFMRRRPRPLEARGPSAFYLTQKLSDRPGRPAAKLGDFHLDYMGAAEFEFDTVPDAAQRLFDHRRDLVIGHRSYQGQRLDFLWIGHQGEPFSHWVDWAQGRRRSDYGSLTEPTHPFYGKQTCRELIDQLNGRPADPQSEWPVVLWWALPGNVVWGFSGGGHVARFRDLLTG